MSSEPYRHQLDVWLFNRQAGILFLQAGRINFQYLPAYLKLSDARPLSDSLPLQSEAFNDNQARPYFEGLLPEGRLRTLLAKTFQVSAQNEFALLDRLGGDCAGAVRLVLAKQGEPSNPAAGSVQWLSEFELTQIIEQLPDRPMLGDVGDLRLSLAGAQDKLPVVFSEGRFGLPKGAMPSTHILKPAIRNVDDSVINEWFCMALARQMGMLAAGAEVYENGPHRFLLVTRYDRVQSPEGALHRLHQEDFCQALSMVSGRKYQNEGGPGVAQCFDLLRRASRPAAVQTLRLFDAMVFNALIGNHDAHAKNFSLLRRDEGVVLAPLYDLLSTAIYPDLTPKMAMSLGGKYKFSEVFDRHWVRYFEAAGMSQAQARKRLIGFARRLPVQAAGLRTQHAPLISESTVVEQILALIQARCALTLERVG